ncbi:TetR/AcrR family transcriptional regulator [Rhodococcus sp. 2H158]
MATASRVGPGSSDGSVQGAGTRERILDATARVLSERGYAGTKLSAIAEYAEIQAPAIYHYFNNRESLIEETMWTGLARLNVVMRESIDAMPAELNALERLLGAVEIHLRYMFSTSDYAVAYIRNTAQLPPAIRERQAQEESRLALVWRDLFQAADEAGFLRRDLDLTIMRLNVVNSLNITAEWWTPRLGTLGELVSTTQEMVRSSVTPR